MAVREGKQAKVSQIRKEEVKLLWPAADMIVYIENPKDSIRKSLELISEFSSQSQDTKSIHRNHLHSYELTMKYEKGKLRNQYHLTLQQKE